MATIITVFGSSRTQPGTPGYDTAVALGKALAEAGFTIANGGYGGTMEATAKGAREAGGHTIGVTAKQFSDDRDIHANQWIKEEIPTQDWKERLFKLVELGAGYVALPGGTGTLVELSVVWEWVNKRFISPRPIVLLGGYWHPVVDAVAQGEIWNHTPVLRAPTPQEAADLLVKHFQESNG